MLPKFTLKGRRMEFIEDHIIFTFGMGGRSSLECYKLNDVSKRLLCSNSVVFLGANALDEV